MLENDYKIKILLIDDERDVYNNFNFSYGEDYEIDYAPSMEFADAKLKNKSGDFDLFLLDLKLDKDEKFEKGLERVRSLKSRFPNIPLIVLTNDNRRDTAVKAMLEGADYFFYKREYDRNNWQNRIETLTKANIQEKFIYKNRKTELLENTPFVGESEQTKEVKVELELLANENVPILITGETGVGKEVAARYLHAYSNRNRHKFVAVNLMAFSENMLESELFGHKAGAFTDAKKDKIGYFEQANKGVLFLDEIGEVNTAIQIKLLRFLEDRIIRPVGGEKDIQLDIRIIAATNKDLKAAIVDKSFREDLYHRLKRYPIYLSPLRERKIDIFPVIAHCLNIPVRIVQNNFFTKEAKELIMNYDFPGNVRELVDAVNYMILRQKLKHKEQIDVACLTEEIREQQKEIIKKETITEKVEESISNTEKIVFLELQPIEDALALHHGSKGAAAKALGKTTDNLRYPIKKYFKELPHLFEKLPTIKKVYKLKKNGNK
jgi:DNA-binding NtrC family response regulator